jgi:hypothetical protein
VPSLAQRPEQHCVLLAHWFPRVLHVAFRAAHVPPVQVWLQHSPFDVQALPSGVHIG